MSAARAIGAYREPLAKFDQYADLPAELRIKVIHEFMADFYNTYPPWSQQKLAPFAAIDSEWQHELEPHKQLWGRLGLTAADLPTYRSMLNQLRSSSLSNVVLWIPIDNKIIDPDQQGSSLSAQSVVTIKSRMAESVVGSLSTLFECLNYATRPQPARKGVKIHTQITIPDTMGFGHEHGHITPDIEFDFSRLPPTDVICKFSQGGFVDLKRKSDEDTERKYKRVLLLSRSSLLSLFSRMPNLEHAGVLLDNRMKAPSDTTTGFNNCPKLKTLSLLASRGDFPGTTLSGWVSTWSHKIVKLRLGNTTHISDFLRTLATPGPATGTINWPNLEEFQISGWYHPILRPFLLVRRRQGDQLHSVLGKIPSALISMPRVKTMVIFLSCPSRRLSTIKTALYLQHDASKLIILARDIYAEKRRRTLMAGILGPNMPRLWTEAAWLWDLADEGSVRSAAADIQAAVQTQHGQNLEVEITPNPY